MRILALLPLLVNSSGFGQHNECVTVVQNLQFLTLKDPLDIHVQGEMVRLLSQIEDNELHCPKERKQAVLIASRIIKNRYNGLSLPKERFDMIKSQIDAMSDSLLKKAYQVALGIIPPPHNICDLLRSLIDVENGITDPQFRELVIDIYTSHGCNLVDLF
jgi:hypothetical protein